MKRIVDDHLELWPLVSNVNGTSPQDILLSLE